MPEFIQMLASGIAAGSSYALMGLAIVITYKTSRVINFAQGEIAMVSILLTYVMLESQGYSFYLALPGALLFAFLLGCFQEYAIMRRAKDASPAGMLITTIGLEMILMGVVSWHLGADPKSLPFPVYSLKTFTIGDLNAGHLGSITFLALIVMVLLFLFLRYSKLGLAIRATQQNLTAASLMGIGTKRILMITWGISSVVGSIAGLLAASTTMQPYMICDPMFKGLAAALIGGMTSLPGAVFGAYLLGIMENLFGGYVSVEFKSVVAFAVIVLVLCIKPSRHSAGHYARKL